MPTIKPSQNTNRHGFFPVLTNCRPRGVELWHSERSEAKDAKRAPLQWRRKPWRSAVPVTSGRLRWTGGRFGEVLVFHGFLFLTFCFFLFVGFLMFFVGFIEDSL